MKTFLLATASLAAIAAFGASAHAADLGARPYNRAPAYAPYAAPLYNWTGFYIGGHLGGAFAGSNAFNGLVLSDYSARLMGGVQAGADWQFHPNVVVGVEGQYSWLGNNALHSIFPNGLVYNNNQRAIASITGRIGYTWGPGLVYVKGGYAYSDNRETLTLAGAAVPFLLSDNHTNGYTVGAGLEYMFAPNWSAKAEYQYYNFGSTTITSGPADVVGVRGRDDEHTVKVGVNYRFGWGGPSAPRY